MATEPFYDTMPGPERRDTLNEMWAIWEAAVENATGEKGWSPLLRAVVDGDRQVLQLYDWTGGEGDKPTQVGYLGASGYVPNIVQALDFRGPQGLQGDTGAQGIQGAKGDTGDTGAQGIQGPKGDKGDKGDQGAQGIKGDTGDAGPQGETGPQGPQGPEGDKGDPGNNADNPDFTATVDSNTGTPSVVVTGTYPNLTLAFQNLKGDTGPARPTGSLDILSSVTYNTPEDCPWNGAEFLHIELWGGGMGGSATTAFNASNISNAGAMGGSYESAILRCADLVFPINIAIGAGGTGAYVSTVPASGATGAWGANGGNTVFGAANKTITAAAGLNGFGRANIPTDTTFATVRWDYFCTQDGGVGGQSVIPAAANQWCPDLRRVSARGQSVSMAGCGGGAGTTTDARFGGGKILASRGGAGGDGARAGDTNVVGGNGQVPGGGGGSASAYSATSGATASARGGNGGDGMCRLEWW